MVSKQAVIDVLKTVHDPEIQVDVWAMGLIYKLEVDEAAGSVRILMTLTTPMCPYGPALLEEIKTRLKSEAGASEVLIDLTFDPPWQPSEELKATLGI